MNNLITKSLALLLSYVALNCNSSLPAKEPSTQPRSAASLTLDNLADEELKKALEVYRNAIKDKGCANDFCFYQQIQISPSGDEVSFSLVGTYNGTNPPPEKIKAIFALCGAFWRYDSILGKERWIGQCLPRPTVKIIPKEFIKTGQPLTLEATVRNPLFKDAGYRLPHVQLYFNPEDPEPTLELGTLTKKD